MEYVSVIMKVPKEASELIDATVGLVEAIGKAGSDGFDAGDIPALTGAAMQVVSEVSDYEEILAEIQADPEAAANLAALTGARILKGLGLL
jgi:hypothetical protein